MCELFGMSSRYSTTVKLSLKAFESHWQKPQYKADGWGVAFNRGKDCLLVKEPIPAGQSETLHFLENNTFRSSLVISHLRRAGKGAKRSFVNTQPFAKELFGRKFIFAHNGFLPQIFSKKDYRLMHFKPLGATDSEHAFCYLLDRMKVEVNNKQKNNAEIIGQLLNHYACKIDKLGKFNFLMSDSKYLYAFRSDNLFTAQRDCVCRVENLKGGPLSVRMRPICPAKNQRVGLIATVPLMEDSCWKPLPLKEVIIFAKGRKIDETSQ